MALAKWLYSILLYAYPSRLREGYGAEMLQLFEDQLREARARRSVGRFVVRMLLDWFRTAPAERFDEWRQAEAPPLSRVLRRGMVISPNPAVALAIVSGVLALRGIRKLAAR